MLKTLIKKQLLELKEQFIPKRYRKQKRSKLGMIGLGLLFGLLFVSVAFAFVGMAMLLCKDLNRENMDWLYYLLFSMIALLVGVVGSVFSTYATLYRAKDNELLLSMPIPPFTLLAARMLTVFMTGFLFELMVLLPAYGVHIAVCGTSVANIVCCLCNLLFMGCLITTFSCLLGWIVALISERTRNKVWVTVLISLTLMGVYYVVYFKLNGMLRTLAEHAKDIGDKISKSAAILNRIAQSYTGEDMGGFALFAIISLALISITFYLLARSFLTITTSNRGEKKAVYVAKKSAQKSVLSALIHKEFRRFTQSVAYLLNNILGVIIELGATAYLLIKFPDARAAIGGFLDTLSPDWVKLLSFAPAAAVCFMSSMIMLTAPSISLEGRSMWVLRSLPVRPVQIFTAKQALHFAIALPGSLLLCCVLNAALSLPFEGWVINLVYVFAFICLTSSLGLTLDLKNPRLDWTNESVPVKQGMPIAITMFGGWALVIASCVGAYFLAPLFNAVPLLVILPLAGALICNWWIYTKGAEVFDAI